MSARKERREFEQHMRSLGLEIIDVRTRKHYAYKVRHPGGEVLLGHHPGDGQRLPGHGRTRPRGCEKS